MKIAYFDCFSGISGDMTLGAFVDAGLDLAVLKERLGQLPIHGYELSAEKVKRAGICGTKVHVIISQKDEHRHKHHNHHHSQYNFSDIQTIIEKSNLHHDIKKDSIRIFHRLATVEAKVHNTSIEEVHFHEVGAIDSIVDIVGSVIALKHTGIEKIYFSPIPTGHGYTMCEHGTFPVPPPAVAELLKGHLLKSVDIAKELTTPTGAAIVTTLGEGIHTIPEMRILQVGYGAGSYHDSTIPNLLRVIIGEITPGKETDEMWVVETNIDNMSGEIIGYVMDKLFEAGAVDVYFTPIQMKKERPGIIISALVPERNLSSVESVLFDQTATFGIRKYKVIRTILTREFKEFDTRLGKIKVKIGKFHEDIKSFSPEYEDCKRIAEEKGIPLKHVYRIISKDLENHEFLK
ncbi:MAG: nickel pincer cofactor biosynthesis protein LarC [Candidatus Jettenia sp.]|uniref:Putative nickel insertion protein n=1 Tax=Candidatus Jettenia caeni TaxID=247490 RepID=I3IQ76_9BACT|nr:nickel pincer cofactor biosynthesis protein LarC [Candidatus Jettenia sp. AMX1]MBC6929889.1 nickel pincer cofactor biosynthesis protein LarC [Candidatus Jettenia sp.]WKZ15187.1 MAG: nickel pincer cofactor biosynthesis protein LarC [Candidatus Jettenia caeni]KAA0248554.1 MAG: nickel pincer cofactor biosynthesis protein LarC [Candidatus Jettenia sp. AMX1]MCE7881792.1 nickel pincer cofactor biosynthesis protein LarC [Candidatus Jettenia sp. AMX1]MCQ3928168.1 nickel pincer cofactor biosynthesis